MPYRLRACCAAMTAAIACGSVPALAQSAFDLPPLGDTALNTIRGSFQPSTPQIVRLQEDFARSDFRLIGSTSGIAMDNWWAQDGARLIAVNIVPR